LTPLVPLARIDLGPLLVINASLFVYAVGAVARTELFVPTPSRG